MTTATEQSHAFTPVADDTLDGLDQVVTKLPARRTRRVSPTTLDDIHRQRLPHG